MSHRRRRRDDDILGIRDDRRDDDVINNTGNCVCDVVRAIDDAQDEAIQNGCDVSCEKSIRNLLGPVQANDFDTVPFMLFCKGDCNPFKATGVRTQQNNAEATLQCIESFIFRVKEVDEDCCAVLELLTTGETDFDPADDEACAQINGVNVNNLQRTGTCITVDLNCFCAITCLPAADLF